MSPIGAILRFEDTDGPRGGPVPAIASPQHEGLIMPFAARSRSRWAPTLLSLILLAACGGDDPVSPGDPVSVSLTPTTATVPAAGSQSFTATVSNADNTAVTWSANGGVVSGTAATVNWLAPPTGGQYTITATSVEDPTKSASATVTVSSAAVTVTPATISLFRGQPQAFTAAVGGVAAGQEGVTWSVSCGTADPAGLNMAYIAPTTAGTCTVTAASTLDPTQSGSATVTVRPDWLVTTTADDAGEACSWDGCTLRAAIALALANPGLDTILVGTGAPNPASGSGPFANGPVTGVITLTSALPQITSPLVILGPGAANLTIDANASPGSPRRVLDFNGEFSGTVSGLTLRGGIAAGTGGVAVGGGADITLRNVVITDNESTAGGGGGLGVITGSTARLENTVVDGNRATGPNNAAGGINVVQNSTLLMTGGSISGNEVPQGWGGGIRLFDGTITLTNVEIAENEAGLGTAGGGGIMAEGQGALTVDGGTVADNVTTGAGGGMWLRGSIATTVTGTTISGNVSATGGGGFQVEGSVNFRLEGATVTDNETAGNGGGLRQFGDMPVALVGTSITGNTAVSGGGIATFNSPQFTMSNTTITGNTATFQAGGLSVGGTSEVTITGGAISNNTSTGGGGAGGVAVNTPSILRTDGTAFVGNEATMAGQLGGAIRAATGASLVLKNGSITANKAVAGSGGGIAAFGDGSVETTVSLEAMTITGNSAAASGGGLWFNNKVALTATGGSIADNDALNGSGGGVFASNATLQVTGTTVTGNDALVQGGGILLVQGSATLTNATLSNNRVTGTGTIGGFTAGIGGGMAAFGNGQITLSGTTISDNSASLVGGGLGLFESTQTTITGGTISNNTSAQTGGGINKGGAATLAINGTTIAGNTAGTQGGGMQLVGTGPVTIDRATIRDNESNTGGGGITAGVVVTITNTTISGNTTGGTGGGVFSSSVANTTIRSSTLSGNSGAIGGGLGVTGAATLRNVTIVGNTATDFGGGVGANNAGAPALTSVLLSGNLRAGAASNCGTGGGAGITSGGNNLSDDGTCTTLVGGGNLSNTPAGIGALADNGGPTHTHALQAGSAAINAGLVAGCPATDQRGYSRAGACDIGAYEFGGTAPANLVTGSALRAPRPAGGASSAPSRRPEGVAVIQP